MCHHQGVVLKKCLFLNYAIIRMRLVMAVQMYVELVRPKLFD